MSRGRRGLGQGRGRREGVCPGEVGGEVCMGREIVSPWRDTSETHRRITNSHECIRTKRDAERLVSSENRTVRLAG